MIELYAMGSPNVVKVFLALEELELPYRTHVVDVFGEGQFDPAFRALNPLAKVPVIVDADGPGGQPRTLFESGLILQYLAEKTGRLLPSENGARLDALQWLYVQVANVGPMFGQAFHFTRFAPKESGHDYALSRYRSQVATLMRVLEDRLAASAYLGGSEYGIADIATFPWTRVVPAILGDGVAAAHPRLTEWAAGIAARPAVVRAIAAADATRAAITLPNQAQPRALDRLFARGEFAVA